MALFDRVPVLVRGGGDLASGVIYRLHRAGFPVLVTELPAPILVRRAVCFGEAVYAGQCTVEGLRAHRTADVAAAWDVLRAGEVPVIVDPSKMTLEQLQPVVVVDARMEKEALDTRLDDAPLVIALGPGFVAGRDCHIVIETNRGHNLGRVIREGPAEPNTGTPGIVDGKTDTRVLRAPAAGHVMPHFTIGDAVPAGAVIAEVAGQPVTAAFDGVLRGIVHPAVAVCPGMKIGDLDPRAQRENCFTISDKSLAIAGGVLEAILSAHQTQPYLRWEIDETQAGF